MQGRFARAVHQSTFGSYNDDGQEGYEDFTGFLKSLGLTQVGLNADWSLEAYQIASAGQGRRYGVLALDNEDRSYSVAFATDPGKLPEGTDPSEVSEDGTSPYFDNPEYFRTLFRGDWEDFKAYMTANLSKLKAYLPGGPVSQAIDIDNGGYQPSEFGKGSRNRPMHPREQQNFPNAKIQEVHIDEIRPGDTILFDGVTKTVTPKDIGGNRFVGKSRFGDSFDGGHVLVKKVTFPPRVSQARWLGPSENGGEEEQQLTAQAQQFREFCQSMGWGPVGDADYGNEAYEIEPGLLAVDTTGIHGISDTPFQLEQWNPDWREVGMEMQPGSEENAVSPAMNLQDFIAYVESRGL